MHVFWEMDLATHVFVPLLAGYMLPPWLTALGAGVFVVATACVHWPPPLDTGDCRDANTVKRLERSLRYHIDTVPNKAARRAEWLRLQDVCFHA